MTSPRLLSLLAVCCALGSACAKKDPVRAPLVPVTVGTAETRAVPYELAATGTVEPMQTVAIQPQVSGLIMRIAFREGQDVKKGQVLFELDPRLERRPNEKLIRKRYASAFKGTNFHEMLASLGIDTLIVTGVSTSHCVYATCRDATDSFRVIVPREAVGERCELMHEVFLLDIDIDLADVMPAVDVVAHLNRLRS